MVFSRLQSTEKKASAPAKVWKSVKIYQIPLFCIAHPYGVISARSCTHTLKTWRICRDIELCQLKNGYSSPTSMGTPLFFQSLQSTYHKLCVRKDSSDFFCLKLNK